MKAVVIILSILAILVCLAIGVYLGKLSVTSAPVSSSLQTSPAPLNSPSAAAPQTPSPANVANLLSNPRQHNLIFVQADDLTNVSPRLESIWLVGYLPGSARISVLLVYPASPTANDPRSNALASTFSISNDGKPSDAFMTSLRSYGFPLNGYFISDTEGTAELVNWLGGIDMGDKQGLSNGPAVLARLTPPWQNLQVSRTSQQNLTEGICARLNQLSTDTNWLPLMMRLIPNHLYTDLSLELAGSDWKQLTSNPDKLSCKVALP